MNTKDFINNVLAALGLGLNQHRSADMDILKAVKEGTIIPKIIHQTYKSRILPPEIQLNIDRIKELNPNWDYRFYDDNDITDFISKNFPQALQYYNRINPKYGAARADLFRYLLIYKEGGVYLDIKSSLTKPLDEVIERNDRYLLSYWRNGIGEMFQGWGLHREIKTSEGEFQTWFLVAAPGHPFLKAVIANVFKNIDIYNPGLHGVGRMGVLRLTGPIAYTLSIIPLLPLYNHRFVQSDTDLGFNYSFLAYKTLFKIHYTDLSEPIVKIGLINKSLAAIINNVRKIIQF